jgi:hypothetical protein
VPEFVKKLFKKHSQEERANHSIASNYRKSIIPKIKKELSYLAESLNIDRSLLFEYSNGTSNLVGLPFLYATATTEVVKPGVNQVSHLYQKMNVSLFADFIGELETKSYFYFEHIDDIKEDYPMVYNYMKPNGVKSGLFYALYDDEDSIGFIVVTSVSKIFQRTEVLPRTAISAQLISSLLNYNKLRKELNY